MTTFDELVDKINSNATNERDRGTMFEKLVVGYLKNEPAFKNQYTNVWMLKDVPEKYGIPREDNGVDIVARNLNGELTAVQAKFYKGRVGKPAIDSFMAEASKNYYSDGMIVSTSDNWDSRAEKTIKGTTKPITRKGLSDLRRANVNWSKFSFDEEHDLSNKKVKKLRGYQKEAISNAVKYYKSDEEFHDRGKLVMAPGTGKTFTSLKITEALMKDQNKDDFKVLYLVPSIQLLSQTLFNWNDDVSDDIHMISFSVVSDRNATKKGKNDEYDLDAKDIGFPATTDVDKLMTNYNYVKDLNNGKKMTVVFSTYQSIDVIHQAQERGYPEFDLIVADEAHRTTGATKLNEDSMFTKVHSNLNIKSKLRLYQTATPKIYDQAAKNKAEQNSIVVSSMDDPVKYGYEIYRLGFGDAVSQGYLTDYKVSVLAVSESYVNKEMQHALSQNNELQSGGTEKIIGVWNAMVKRNGITGEITGAPIKRAISFTDKIKHSKAIASEFETTVNEYLDTQSSESFKVDVRHVDGKLNALEKKDAIDWLASDNIQDNHARILSNVKFLTEGIDVPNLDAIIFFSPKKSQVDIVQAIGRIMRKAKNKEYGYIILPIVIEDGVDPSAALDNDKKYQEVWQVLNALRSTDDRFDAEVNKIDLNKHKPENLDFIGVDSSPNDSVTEQDASNYLNKNEPEQLELPLDWQEIRNAFYGKVVKKVGDRRYLEDWSKDVADIAKRHITRISDLIDSNDGSKLAFDKFLNSLHYNINNSIDKKQAVEMLAQHLITEPIFEALFGESSFVNNNAVSKAMNEVVSAFSVFGFDKEQEELKPFYDSIKLRANGIDNAEGKQKLILTLYDKFFRTGFKKTTEQLGIVFTPVEVVDFIIKSVESVMNEYFDKKLVDKDVHILDPFTGTGTFMTRILYHFKEQLDNGIITYDDILRNYMHEMHANEIVLLSYYIAAINIESTFEDIHKIYGNGDNDYKTFDGIVLTDTFASTEHRDLLDDKLFGENDKRLKKEQEKDITAIISNPPYSMGQTNANDNNQNVRYPYLSDQIMKTYAKESKAGLKKSLYDSYVKAVRWATDRIDGKGVIGFITNSSYIDLQSMDGFRKTIAKEFNHIYIYDLLGGIRNKIGKEADKQGKNIFNIITGVAIMILVKDDSDEHEIKYASIGDYLSRKDKLDKLVKIDNIKNVKWKKIIPNKSGDWINQRNMEYYKFMPIFDKDNDERVFQIKGSGVVTNRDAWVYNFNSNKVLNNVKLIINTYNNELKNKLNNKNYVVTNDSSKIKWSVNLRKYLKKHYTLENSGEIITSLYRPFVKRKLYFDKYLNERPGTLKKHWGNNNIAILTTGKSSQRGFNTLVADCLPDINVFNGGSQVFVLYDNPETKDKEINLLDNNKFNFTRKFIDRVNLTPQDAFYYIYGVFNSKEYRKKYSNDLVKSLPRIPKLNNKMKYVEIGEKLMKLHLAYENQKKWDGVNVEFMNDNPSYRVNKMKHPKKGDKEDLSTIIYNSDIKITNIPEEAYKYVINGRSAIGWIINQYKITTDKKSGIIDDPNEFSDDPKYILNLLLSVITVSMKTLELMDQLPKLEIVDDDK